MEVWMTPGPLPPGPPERTPATAEAGGTSQQMDTPPDPHRRATAPRVTSGSRCGACPGTLPRTWSLNASSATSFRLMSTLKYAPNVPVSRALAATCNRRQEWSWPSVTRADGGLTLPTPPARAAAGGPHISLVPMAH